MQTKPQRCSTRIDAPLDRAAMANNGRIIGGLDEERLRRVLSSLLRNRIQPLPFRRKAS